ncbi:MAG: M23 family metallopeptidase [Burkholderiales bacterium]|nr:M23 family metallopeptidase [Burkholderiales bacterium]
MSFILYAAGSTSARVRTLSIRTVLFGGLLAASGLLAAGAGVGYWMSAMYAQTQPVAHAAPERGRSALPFAVEQLGALSGRLFKLESQASQLSERIGVKPAIAPRPAARARAADTATGSGGPLLPPRVGQEALDNLGALQARLDGIEQQITLVSDAAALQNLAQMRLPSRLPVGNAPIGSTFGNREDPFTGRRAFHSGLDFAAVWGTLIHAAAGGTVSFAGVRHDYGWVVEIDHGNGLTTRYAHASRLLVKVGDVVMPGDPIAAVGSTGRSTGPHLHFEVLRNGEATDPRRYLAGL